MPCSPTLLYSWIQSCLRDYDRIQSLAVVLIYIQMGFALIGSLGAWFNGVLLINLVVTLFALVAIESSSHSLGRAYAVLLICLILLDITWFILFSHTIWYVTRDSISEERGLRPPTATAVPSFFLSPPKPSSAQAHHRSHLPLTTFSSSYTLVRPREGSAKLTFLPTSNSFFSSSSRSSQLAASSRRSKTPTSSHLFSFQPSITKPAPLPPSLCFGPGACRS